MRLVVISHWPSIFSLPLALAIFSLHLHTLIFLSPFSVSMYVSFKWSSKSDDIIEVFFGWEKKTEKINVWNYLRFVRKEGTHFIHDKLNETNGKMNDWTDGQSWIFRSFFFWLLENLFGKWFWNDFSLESFSLVCSLTLPEANWNQSDFDLDDLFSHCFVSFKDKAWFVAPNYTDTGVNILAHTHTHTPLNEKRH